MAVENVTIDLESLYKVACYCRAVQSRGTGSAGVGVGEVVASARKTNFFSNIVFDFAGLFLVAILVQNLYTGDPEGVQSLPPQTKKPRYGPVLKGTVSHVSTVNLCNIHCNSLEARQGNNFRNNFSSFPSLN